jgi:hypothetical protein
MDNFVTKRIVRYCQFTNWLSTKQISDADVVTEITEIEFRFVFFRGFAYEFKADGRSGRMSITRFLNESRSEAESWTDSA